MKVKEIVKIIEDSFPLSTQESYDNCGLIISGAEETDGVYCALDLTAEVVDAAVAGGCQMIVVHHPPIFHAIKSVDARKQSAIVKAIAAGLSVYAAHTIFDIGEGGINDGLAKIFDLSAVRPLADSGLGKVGMLSKPITLREFAKEVATSLDDTHIKTVGDLDGKVEVVALCSGGGGDVELVDIAKAAGADVYVTGDVPHHVALYAGAVGIKLVVFGHYESEHIFCKLMADFLSKKTNSKIKTVADNIQASPFNKETV